MRYPIGRELKLVRSGLPDGVAPLIVVRQFAPGVRIRLPVGLSPPLPPLNSELTARDGFEYAAASSPKLAQIIQATEQMVRERVP